MMKSVSRLRRIGVMSALALGAALIPLATAGSAQAFTPNNTGCNTYEQSPSDGCSTTNNDKGPGFTQQQCNNISNDENSTGTDAGADVAYGLWGALGGCDG
ncbi:MAG TPA: hypothetical protein VNU19_02080 [Candidatus Acidoferrum sp.]|jgi:hypothetical protein|nr:hypothetical protein [Candidatus Acidoferrum sp.]